MQDFTEQAKALVAQMTVEERASMLRYDAPAIPRLGIPAYNWWNEALHGVARAGTATVFPQAIALAATFDRDLLYSVGEVISEEGRAKYNAASTHGDRGIYMGLTFWSPNINIFRDPRWGRGHETYGEDPYLTGEMGCAFVRGIQQKDERGYLKAAACAKHFAVHSGPEDLRHGFNAEVGKKDLYETYLYAFKKLVTEAKVEGVMGSYNAVNGTPACCNSFLLKDLLRDQWGFDGYTVSDCGAIADIYEHHRTVPTALEAAKVALEGGCDLNCGGVYAQIMAAYERGMISEEVITECAEHAMRTRLRLGLMDPECGYNAIDYDCVACDKHQDIALDAARKSIVLLKNDGILPLRDVRTVAVIGPNADNRVALLGNYHGTGDGTTTLLDAMRAEKGIKVHYAEGCHLYLDRVENCAQADDRLSEAVILAERSDVVLLCLGLDETLEAEEGDKTSLGLPASQQKLLETVCATGKPVVCIVISGSATDLSYADAHCAAVVQAWYPGAHGGAAIADVLMGRVSPSGKLPITFYRSLDDLPEFTDYAMTNRTYRYFKGEPLYPFGYGLSYADIALNAAEWDCEKQAVNVTVANRSDFAAREVVQIYVRNDGNPLAPANPVLWGFEPVELSAGESKTFSVPVDPCAFTVVDEAGKRIPGQGHFSVYVGFGQPNAESLKIVL